MSQARLTPRQRELFEALKQTPGGALRKHIKPTNTICYRLLDHARNPIQNYRYGLVHQLEDKNVLTMDSDHNYILRATSEA